MGERDKDWVLREVQKDYGQALEDALTVAVAMRLAGDHAKYMEAKNRADQIRTRMIELFGSAP